MRELADAERIGRLMRGLAAAADRETRIYFTGGATAVLLGWRATTIDADILILPESDRIFRAIPELPGWSERSPLIAREGRVSFHHYDLYAQALAKIERGHRQDKEDVREMLSRGLVEPERLRAYYEQIEPQLHRFPALDPRSFRRSLEQALASSS